MKCVWSFAQGWLLARFWLKLLGLPCVMLYFGFHNVDAAFVTSMSPNYWEIRLIIKVFLFINDFCINFILGVGPVLPARQSAFPDHQQDSRGEFEDIFILLLERLWLLVTACFVRDVWTVHAHRTFYHQQDDYQRGTHGMGHFNFLPSL